MRSEHEHAEDGAGYERPERGGDGTLCSYTEYDQRASVDGDVPATGHGAEGLERRVWDALYGVEDPEMPISVVDLGLVYDLEIDETAGTAAVRMTLTYTGCPAREMLLDDVEEAVETVEGIEAASVELVWSPPWEVGLVTKPGKDALREFGLSI
jgi:metal-sulfur cluster biosynthetic enzyme